MEMDDITQLSTEIAKRYGGDMSSDLFANDEMCVDETEGDPTEPDDVIILHMDIRGPLKKLQALIEDKIGVDLTGYTFWLQDAQELEPHKNLVDQCVKGEGLVQINVQVQTDTRRINIVDVLKPTEAVLAALGNEDPNIIDSIGDDSNGISLSPEDVDAPCVNWVQDLKFKAEQLRLKIPEDPVEWSAPQVKFWLQWAVRTFDLTYIKMSDWDMTGEELCSLTDTEFKRKVQIDPGDLFLTHFKILRDSKFVSNIQQMSEEDEDTEVRRNNPNSMAAFTAPREPRILGRTTTSGQSRQVAQSLNEDSVPLGASPLHTASSTATANITISPNHNGQVQLWQFLLELLTDREHVNIIQWVGGDGEFKLTDPEAVARLWGEKKNKPAMNYEKLSRALRYYYDGDMISKVSGKRFAYKFDCDLKYLIGYDAGELAALVNEKAQEDEYLQALHEMHNISKDGGEDDEGEE